MKTFVFISDWHNTVKSGEKSSEDFGDIDLCVSPILELNLLAFSVVQFRQLSRPILKIS